MLVASADLANEVFLESRAGAARFARDGWAVGRQLLPAAVVREVRRPMIELLLTEEQIEASPDHPDRFRWIGDPSRTRERMGALFALNAQEPLIEPGYARRAVEHVWGKSTAIWGGGASVYLSYPDGALEPEPYKPRIHRDGWHTLGYGEITDYCNLWLPLTQIGESEGALALLPGSHGTSDDEPEHAERYADRWRSTAFEVGDFLLFRPDLLHAATVNQGPYLRIALRILCQDARVTLPPSAGLSTDRTQALGLVESCVLAVLSLGPMRQYHLWVQCTARGYVGRYGPILYTTVTRATELLAARGLIESSQREGAPIFRVTAAGLEASDAWLARPVENLDQIAFTLPVKLELLARRGLDPTKFVEGQRAALDGMEREVRGNSLHDLWRRSLLAAAAGLLDGRHGASAPDLAAGAMGGISLR